MDRHSDQEPKMDDLPVAEGEELRVEQQPSRDVGKVIAEAREARGLTQADLAQSLNLDLRVVELIEAGRLDQAPEPIYVRAYLKSWAGMLDLDAKALVADYDHQRSEPERQAIRANSRKTLAVMEEKSRSGGVKGRVWRWLLLLIVLVVVVLLAAQFIPAQWRAWIGGAANQTSLPTGDDGGSQSLPMIQKQSSTVPAPPGMPQEKPSGSEPGQNLPPKPLAAIPGSAQQAPASPKIQSAGPVQNAGEAGQPAAASAGTPSSQAPDTSKAASGAVADSLVIKAQGADCWVEVKNAAGTRLMYDVLKSGDERRFGGSGPFSVVLGNPSAVKVLWQGKPVSLGNPNNTTGIVRIKVGGS